MSPWCAGGVPVSQSGIFRWCPGGVLMSSVSQWCLGGVSVGVFGVPVVSWWCPGGVPVYIPGVSRWCPEQGSHHEGKTMQKSQSGIVFKSNQSLESKLCLCNVCESNWTSKCMCMCLQVCACACVWAWRNTHVCPHHMSAR